MPFAAASEREFENQMILKQCGCSQKSMKNLVFATNRNAGFIKQVLFSRMAVETDSYIRLRPAFLEVDRKG